jgi:plasmid stability protein
MSRENIEMVRRGAKVLEEFPSRSQEKIVVRLPDGMRDQLAAAAAANNRSTNAEVVSRLQRSFEAEKSPPRTQVNPATFTDDHELATLIDNRLLDFRDQLFERLDRLEGLHSPPAVPKDRLSPPEKVNPKKPKFIVKSKEAED